MATRFSYPVDVSPDGDGLLVVFPDIRGAATGGATMEEALNEARDCLEEALARIIDDREPLPRPSPARGRPRVTPGALIAAKAALWEAMNEAGVSRTALARDLSCDEAEVRRMLNPRHATKIARLEDALVLLGKRLVVGIEAA